MQEPESLDPNDWAACLAIHFEVRNQFAKRQIKEAATAEAKVQRKRKVTSGELKLHRQVSALEEQVHDIAVKMAKEERPTQPVDAGWGNAVARQFEAVEDNTAELAQIAREQQLMMEEARGML